MNYATTPLPNEFSTTSLPKNFSSDQLEIYCHGKMCCIELNNPVAWIHLGKSFKKNTNCHTYESLPVEFPFGLLPNNLSSIQFAFFCIGKALSLAPDDPMAWKDLGDMYLSTEEPNDIKLPDDIIQYLPPFQNFISLVTFCYGKALCLAPNDPILWKKLAYIFAEKHATYMNLPNQFLPNLLPSNLSSSHIAIFCYTKALSFNVNDMYSWVDLAKIFEDGVTYLTLPEGFPSNILPQISSSFQLTAFCYIKALCLKPDIGFYWERLGNAFKQGATDAVLPQEIIEAITPLNLSQNKTIFQFAIFCFAKALSLYLPNKNTPDLSLISVWENLGELFANCTTVIELPEEIRTTFTLSPNTNSYQLANFCFEKTQEIKSKLTEATNKRKPVGEPESAPPFKKPNLPSTSKTNNSTPSIFRSPPPPPLLFHQNNPSTTLYPNSFLFYPSVANRSVALQPQPLPSITRNPSLPVINPLPGNSPDEAKKQTSTPAKSPNLGNQF